MTVGYISVSTADQNPARQEEALKQHGVERIFDEMQIKQCAFCFDLLFRFIMSINNPPVHLDVM